MGSVNLELLAQASWQLRSSYSITVTVPSGVGPCSVLVAVYTDYGDEFTYSGETGCTIDGVTVPQLCDVNAIYCRTRMFLANFVNPGSRAVVVSPLRSAHNTGCFIVGIYNTAGLALSNFLTYLDPPNSYTASPTIVAGHLWLEMPGEKSTSSVPTAGSGQTSLVSKDSRRVQYKKDTGTGIQSFITNFANDENNNFIGMEFLPPGRTFEIPPLAIG